MYSRNSVFVTTTLFVYLLSYLNFIPQQAYAVPATPGNENDEFPVCQSGNANSGDGDPTIQVTYDIPRSTLEPFMFDSQNSPYHHHEKRGLNRAKQYVKENVLNKDGFLETVLEKSPVLGYVPAVCFALAHDRDRAIRAAARCTGTTCQLGIHFAAGFVSAALTAGTSGVAAPAMIPLMAAGGALGGMSRTVIESHMGKLIHDPKNRGQLKHMSGKSLIRDATNGAIIGSIPFAYLLNGALGAVDAVAMEGIKHLDKSVLGSVNVNDIVATKLRASESVGKTALSEKTFTAMKDAAIYLAKHILVHLSVGEKLSVKYDRAVDKWTKNEKPKWKPKGRFADDSSSPSASSRTDRVVSESDDVPLASDRAAVKRRTRKTNVSQRLARACKKFLICCAPTPVMDDESPMTPNRDDEKDFVDMDDDVATLRGITADLMNGNIACERGSNSMHRSDIDPTSNSPRSHHSPASSSGRAPFDQEFPVELEGGEPIVEFEGDQLKPKIQ